MFGQSIPLDDHEDPEMIRRSVELDGDEKEISLLAPNKNYRGSWTDLFYERVKNETTKKKFLASKENNQTTERRTSHHYKVNPGVICLVKPEDIPLDEYVASQTGYDKNRDKVFSSKKKTMSKEHNKFPINKGLSLGYGDEGVVFDDAVTDKSGEKLTEHQMDIILAHEKAHGIFGRLTRAEKRIILEPFNRSGIGYGFSEHADEVLARMSQLKNYFGFTGDEEFRVEHLNYAKKHYVEDTGLDNNMTSFFKSIIDEQKFIDVMNTMPC